jgi:hypothetical protein
MENKARRMPIWHQSVVAYQLFQYLQYIKIDGNQRGYAALTGHTGIELLQNGILNANIIVNTIYYAEAMPKWNTVPEIVPF